MREKYLDIERVKKLLSFFETQNKTFYKAINMIRLPIQLLSEM